MKLRILSGWLLFSISTGLAAASYQLDPARSRLEFRYVQMGVPVTGHFKTLQAQVQFDPARPEATQVQVSVALASVEVGTADGNAEAQRPAWFDVRRFPEAQFITTQVQALGGERYRVRGELRLKGKVTPLEIMAQAESGPGGLTLRSQFDLQRLALGIGTGLWADTETVADTVQITLTLTLVPAA